MDPRDPKRSKACRQLSAQVFNSRGSCIKGEWKISGSRRRRSGQKRESSLKTFATFTSPLNKLLTMRPSKRQEDGIKATDADWFLHKMKRTTAVPFQLQANREAFRRKNELPITRRLDEAMRVEKIILWMDFLLLIILYSILLRSMYKIEESILYVKIRR